MTMLSISQEEKKCILNELGTKSWGSWGAL